MRKIIKSSLRTGFGDKKLYVVPKVLRKRQNKTYNDKNRIKEGFSNEEGILSTVSKLAVKVLNKSLRAEADSACALLGYQPRMPETVKKFKKEKK